MTTRTSEWLTTSDVAERYHVPEATVRYWKHIGYGPGAIKIGRHVRYAAADWDLFIAEQVAKAEQDSAAQRSRTAV